MPAEHTSAAYLQALAETPECSAVVLSDPDRSLDREAARVLGSKLTGTYESANSLLEREHPQMALVTMEARVAPPVIDAVLEADCHVFAEKPACVDVEDFESLVQQGRQQAPEPDAGTGQSSQSGDH